ncbi:hypothetical protein IMSAGC022_01107 [Alistipes sp.]|nr:hypothetical protein IMSAGC022_01107 [Alistipes sp.]
MRYRVAVTVRRLGGGLFRSVHAFDAEHVAAVGGRGVAVEPYIGVAAMKPVGKRYHADYAARGQRRVTVDLATAGEYLGVVVVHAACYGLVLAASARRQVSVTVPCMGCDSLHIGEQLPSRRCELSLAVGLAQHFERLHVGLGRCAPAAAVTAVVADVERLEALGRRRRSAGLVVVGVVYAAGALGACGYLIARRLRGRLQRREGEQQRRSAAAHCGGYAE